MNEVQQSIARLRDLHDGAKAFFDVVRAGSNAIPGLQAIVREPPQSVFAHRCLAVDALAAIATSDAWSALFQALEDLVARDVPASLAIAEDAVVDRIAMHLADSNDPRAADALLTALAARPRGEVARALGKLHEKRAIPMLVACLDDDLAREGAMEALALFGAAALDALTHKLIHPGGDHTYEASHLTAAREAAATLLGQMATPAALTALATALSDPQRRVRRAAAIALAQSAPARRGEAIPVLIETLDDDSWLAAKPAVEALVSFGGAATEPLLQAVAIPPRDAAGLRRRERALEALARLAPPQAVPVLERLAHDGDSQTGLAAVAVLEAIPSSGAATALTAFLGHPAPSVRERAVRALAERDGPAAVALARALNDPDKRVRRTVWECAASLSPASHAAFEAATLQNGSLLQKLTIRLRLRSRRGTRKR